MILKKDATEDKLRGGFYTPEKIASFMLKWGLSSFSNASVLEPSCGDGVFLRELKKTGLSYSRLTAIEYDRNEAEKARSIELNKAHVITADFHSFCLATEDRFDLILGNPPYIRYQYFNHDQQAYAAEIFNKANLKCTKLTNAWVSFVVGASLLLKKKGKIAFVLPADLLQVSYAQTLRSFLACFYNKLTIISFKQLVFENIQQDVLILLCEKDGTEDHMINHLELEDASDLEHLDISQIKPSDKQVDISDKKWSYYFLNAREISFIKT